MQCFVISNRKKKKKTIKCEIKNVCQHFLKYTLREGLLTGRRWQPYFDSIYKKKMKFDCVENYWERQSANL